MFSVIAQIEYTEFYNLVFWRTLKDGLLVSIEYKYPIVHPITTADLVSV